MAFVGALGLRQAATQGLAGRAVHRLASTYFLPALPLETRCEALPHRGQPTATSDSSVPSAVALKPQGRAESFWHSVPYRVGDQFSFVVEIPKDTRAKMEIDLAAEQNPIVQDEKDGKPRFYHEPICWNYGCIPQTWEDPALIDRFTQYLGDGDPIDVVEIGPERLEMGEVVKLEVLGCLALIDEGECDYKVIGIAQRDGGSSPSAPLDPEFVAGEVVRIREWFRDYKIPDGKPANEFARGGAFIPLEETLEIIEETHRHWRSLVGLDTDGA